MNEQLACLIAELTTAITANTLAQSRLASEIRSQCEAIDSLIDALTSQDDEDDEPDGPTFLGDVM